MNERVVILSNVSAGLINFRRELLEELTSKYEVIVIASDNGGRTVIENLGCQFIDFTIERHGVNPIKEAKLVKNYISLIKKMRPFVVLTYTIKPNIYGGIACRMLNIPFIPNVTGLGDAIENPGLLSILSRMMYKVGLKNAHIVFFQNKSNYDFFRSYSIYKGSSYVLPGSGVNLKKHCFESYPDPEDSLPLVLCVVGRITKDKGILEIIEASRNFDKEILNIQLIGNCEDDYLPMIREAEKKGVISYHGRQENVHEWLKKAHGILHASYHEGMSNVLLEAAACGRPILASLIPGCMEIFDDEKSGIGFMPKSADEISKAIVKFINIPYEKKREMGINGRRKVEEQFDRKFVVNKYVEQIDMIRSLNRRCPSLKK